MKRVLIIAAVSLGLFLLVGIVGIEVWYRMNYPAYSFRYRLTVNVEADGKVHTGTGIIRITWAKQVRVLPDVFVYSLRAHGQAVVVDLGERGLLLVPKGGKVSKIPFLAFKDTLPAWRRVPRTPEEMRAFLKKRGTVEVSEDLLPLFIWLPDPSDPDSGRYALPSELSTAIGPDVHLRSATVEISDRILDTPVSTGIEKRLPWLVEMTAYQREHVVIGKVGEFSWRASSIWDVN
ncbi:hypothetical protein [Parvibaculum sp. MBR-TMA-1.3b-4.2]|jgi:uncharacterized membrane protein